MTATHNRIIARLAKSELEPPGFRQRGRSRQWLADHGTWLNVVEFTPDRFTKAVSLVNAVHWLWAGTGFLALHESILSPRRAEFETDEQFGAAVRPIVEEACAQAAMLENRFATLDGVTTFLIARARSSPDRMMPSWWGYQAGIAAGMTGDFSAARTFLEGITDSRVEPHAKRMLKFVGEPRRFDSEVRRLQRHALGLPVQKPQPSPT